MKEINGKTRICGLLANPVEHTLSPLIHNTLAEQTGINLAYVPFKPEKDGLAAAVRGAYELNVLGLNVSVPFKSQVIESLKEIDPMAKDIGAVNTLVRIEGGYKGYNTDIMGLKRAMELEGIALKGKQAVLLGAGGASKAIAYLCISEGAEKVWILNRTYANAEQLAVQLNNLCHAQKAEAMALSDYAELFDKKELSDKGYLAIQTTNVGMYPNTDSAAIENKAFYQAIEDKVFYQRAEAAYDLVYTPFTTKFMKNAMDCGVRAYNGLRMLLYQGVCAYELWNQTSVPDEISELIYEKLKKELGV